VREKSMVRRTLLLLTTIGVGVLLASGVALAANLITCQEGILCEGTTGDDEMIGTSSNDNIYAKEGNDILHGGGSFDDLRGGPGNDDLDGGRGNDQYNIYDNNWGVDRISGDLAGAKDWLIFQISSGALTIDLTPTPGKPEVSSGANTINFASDVVIEWVQAGPAKDTIKGNSADNYLSGANDDDTLIGRKGDDNLRGDIVEFSNIGNDTLNGGQGNDDLDGGPGGDSLTGGPDNDVLDGGPGNDVFYAQDGEADEIICGPGADVIHADPSGIDSISIPDCIDFIGP
jgi:Ca2+-binding RTX toxin-like protein